MRDAALAAVEGDVAAALAQAERLEAAPRLADGRLDLDDVGAHVGQQHAAERAGDDLR